MVKERIIDWVLEQNGDNKRLPINIIYYRDGMSDAQYLEVRDTELPAIENAFADAVNELRKSERIADGSTIPKINITAIVCVKRHSVRFYPLPNDGDRHQNCPPGTQVESIVTSPFFNDFYLQSHAAIKGTAKPCHYFVLRNDMNMSIHDIRTLTHELCYTYVRAPCGVSYASPGESKVDISTCSSY
jgi:eukaryotic translation initiation factor 2C